VVVCALCNAPSKVAQEDHAVLVIIIIIILKRYNNDYIRVQNGYF